MREFVIGKNDAGQRLDKFISKAVPAMPPSMLYKCIRLKKIKVNMKRAVPEQKLAEGDTVRFFVRDEFFGTPTDDKTALLRIKPNLDIIFEDENVMILNKRPGVLVHSDEAGNENTLITHVIAYLAQKGEYKPEEEQSFAPALCNRIDRNTGGLVIAAKNAEALREMNELIKNGKVHKSYLCAVHGTPFPSRGRLRGWLIKDAKTNTVTVTDKKRDGAKECITDYRVLASKNGSSLVEVDLITGRTHQIRAQFAHIGHALLGDGKYGVNRKDREKGYKYQALYAYRVSFDVEDGLLSYLNGKEFRLPEGTVWFEKEYR